MSPHPKKHTKIKVGSGLLNPSETTPNPIASPSSPFTTSSSTPPTPPTLPLSSTSSSSSPSSLLPSSSSPPSTSSSASSPTAATITIISARHHRLHPLPSPLPLPRCHHHHYHLCHRLRRLHPFPPPFLLPLLPPSSSPLSTSSSAPSPPSNLSLHSRSQICHRLSPAIPLKFIINNQDPKSIINCAVCLSSFHLLTSSASSSPAATPSTHMPSLPLPLLLRRICSSRASSLRSVTSVHKPPTTTTKKMLPYVTRSYLIGSSRVRRGGGDRGGDGRWLRIRSSRIVTGEPPSSPTMVGTAI